ARILSEWKTFLDFYVARSIPSINPTLRSAAPLLFKEIFGASIRLGPDRFASYATYEEAKPAYEAEDDLRVIFDVGAKPGGTPYAPEGSFERRYSGWPVPGVQALRYYFEPDGSLNEAKPSTTADAGSSFNHNPALARTGNMVGDNP